MKTPNNHALVLAVQDHHTLGYQNLPFSQFHTNSILTCGWKTLLTIMLFFSVFLYVFKINLLVHDISYIWGWQDFTLMTEDWVVTNKLVFCHVLYSLVLYCAVLFGVVLFCTLPCASQGQGAQTQTCLTSILNVHFTYALCLVSLLLLS